MLFNCCFGLKPRCCRALQGIPWGGALSLHSQVAGRTRIKECGGVYFLAKGWASVLRKDGNLLNWSRRLIL